MYYYREDYIEALIKLVELNDDHYWLPSFRLMRSVSSVVGGGAGSLNDWSPSYKTIKENAWYGALFHLLFEWYLNESWEQRHGDKNQISLLKSPGLTEINYLEGMTCNTCKQAYVLPSRLERFIARYMLRIHLLKSDKNLINWLDKKESINSSESEQIRQSLNDTIQAKKITISPFKPNCQHCDTHRNFTRHGYVLERVNNQFSMTKRANK